MTAIFAYPLSGIKKHEVSNSKTVLRVSYAVKCICGRRATHFLLCHGKNDFLRHECGVCWFGRSQSRINQKMCEHVSKEKYIDMTLKISIIENVMES